MTPDQHQDYTLAKEKGYPEVYIPYHYEQVILGEEIYEDWEVGYGRGLLDLGYRISPEGMRSLIIVATTSYYDSEKGRIVTPRNHQDWIANLAYARYTDLLSEDEFTNIIAKGKVPRNHFSQTKCDFYESSRHHRFYNAVMPTMEEVALDIAKKRRIHPDLKVLLLHGTWNRLFPHPGQILTIKDATAYLTLYGVDMSKLIVVVAADTNPTIEAAGKIPVGDSLLRMSSISYLPGVDYVCSCGNIPFFGKNSERIRYHFNYKYALLAPDFLYVGDDHPRRSEIESYCRVIGIEPISFPRFGKKQQPKFGDPNSLLVEDPISSRKLFDGNVDEFSLSRAINLLLGTKRVNEIPEYTRDWFTSRYVVTPSSWPKALQAVYYPPVYRPN